MEKFPVILHKFADATTLLMIIAVVTLAVWLLAYGG